jgi:hypothetical protein
VIKSSWAISLVSWLKIADISGTDMVLETSVIFKQLTCLIAREDFITFSQHKASDPTVSVIFVFLHC